MNRTYFLGTALTLDLWFADCEVLPAFKATNLPQERTSGGGDSETRKSLLATCRAPTFMAKS
jgi:hypothetical protein